MKVIKNPSFRLIEIRNHKIRKLIANKNLIELLDNLNYEELTGLESTYISPKSVIGENVVIRGKVFIDDDVRIQDYSYIIGPAVIMKGTLIGKSAFIRGGCYIGENTIIGHSTEIINSFIFDHTNIAHFNTITKSLIGNYVNFSSYASTSSFNLNDEISDTGIHQEKKIYLSSDYFISTTEKFGAIIGDFCRMGAYSMTYPGVTLGKNCIAFPHLMIKEGFYSDNTTLYLESYYTHIKKRKTIGELD